MSNYVQSTNFATKDSLPLNDPLKIVKGTEINTEYNNIATAVATKADLVSPTFTGSPTAPTQSFGNNSTLLSTTAFVQAAMAVLHPVGSIYLNATNSTNPGTLLGFGTWVAFGAGRVPVGFNAANPLFDTAEETGGSADAVLPTHNHSATSTVTDPGHLHNIDVSISGNFPAGGPVGATNQGVVNTAATQTASTSITVSTSIANAGTSATNANYQPYITVFMWKRTA